MQRPGVQQRRERGAERQAAIAELADEQDVQRRVGQHAERADDHRRPAVAERVERRRRDLDDRVAGQANGVGHERPGRGRGVERRELSAFEEQRDNRLRQHDEADGRRHVQRQHHREARRHGLAHAGDVVVCGAPRDGGQRRRRDRHAEDAERQIHQPERIAQPRHGARALAGRQPRVHEHVDLRRRQAERARPHQQQHLSQSRLGRVEHGLVPVAFAHAGPATGSATCARPPASTPIAIA